MLAYDEESSDNEKESEDEGINGFGPTDYELAVMANGVYEAESDIYPKTPDDWYIIHKFFPNNLWDHGLIIYERIINIDASPAHPEEQGKCGIPLTRPWSHERQDRQYERKVVLLSVEWVIAFRGTVPSSLWNWITNFGLFWGQIPPFSYVEMPSETSSLKEIIINRLYHELEEEESELVIHPVAEGEITKEFPNQYKSQLLNYIKQGCVIERRVFAKTFTGHSLGASMAVIRACSEQRTEPYKGGAIVRAVVFDSPGTYPMLNDEDKVWADNENLNGEKNVVSYLSAPNIVNTLHSHAGQIRRLYIPHLKSDYLKFMNRMFWIYDIACGIGVGIFLKWIRDDEIAKKGESLNLFELGSMGVFYSLCAGIGHSILRLFLFNGTWLLNQHDMCNIVDCFNPRTGNPQNVMGLGFKNGAVVKSWPDFWTHNIGSKVLRAIYYPYPFFPLDRGLVTPLNRGLLTGAASFFSSKVTSENIVEAQSSFGVIYKK